MADIKGIDPKLLSSPEVLKQKRDARAEQTQMANQLAMAQAGADIAKTGSEASKNLKEDKGGQPTT